MSKLYTVGCTFATASKTPSKQKLYTYKTYLDLAVGDLVVVPVANSLNFKVVRVGAVHDKPRLSKKLPYDIAWVVDKIDPTNWENIMREEKKEEEKCVLPSRL